MEEFEKLKLIGAHIDSADIASGLIMTVRDSGVSRYAFIPGAIVALHILFAKEGITIEGLKKIYQDCLQIYSESQEEYLKLYDTMGK